MKSGGTNGGDAADAPWRAVGQRASATWQREIVQWFRCSPPRSRDHHAPRRNSALSEPRHFNLLEPNVGPLTRCRGDALTRSKRLGSSMFDVICWSGMMVRLVIPGIAAVAWNLFLVSAACKIAQSHR